YNCPLVGTLSVDLHITAEHNFQMKNFLNFCDESGDGSIWRRYWCVLEGFVLSYWRYPEDEVSKPCLGSFSLKQCINPTIEPVSADICARKHTFLLLMVPSKGKTQVRINYLLHKGHKSVESSSNRYDQRLKKKCNVIN